MGLVGSVCSMLPAKVSIAVRLEEWWDIRLSRIQVVEAPSKEPISRTWSGVVCMSDVRSSQSGMSHSNHFCEKVYLLRGSAF